MVLPYAILMFPPDQYHSTITKFNQKQQSKIRYIQSYWILFL